MPLTPVAPTLQSRRLVADISTVAVETVSSRSLVLDACAIAITTGSVTVYDAMYLALAIRLETKLITADDRLVRSVASQPMIASYVQAVQELL
jgi:predicted nucleic acid-binding protein